MLVANAIAPASRAGISYDSTVLADTPVAFWPLNETSGTAAADSTGNGHGATYTGGFTLNQTGIGDGEPSVAFNGTTGWVNVPSSVALTNPLALNGQGNMSLELWIKSSSTTSRLLMHIPNFTQPFQYWLFNGTPRLDVGTNNAQSNVGATTGITTSAWIHLVVVCLGSVSGGAWTGTVTHYKNGASNGSGSITSQATNAGTIMGIGGDSGSAVAGAGFFAGNIAKPAFYNYALTATQVSNHFAAQTSTGAAVLGTGGQSVFQSLARASTI